MRTGTAGAMRGGEAAWVKLKDRDLPGANFTRASVNKAGFHGALLKGAIWVDGKICGGGSLGRCK